LDERGELRLGRPFFRNSVAHFVRAEAELRYGIGLS
jgi:hypothetical protein